MPDSFQILTITQGTQKFLLFLFLSNFIITGFIYINCITVFNLWKQLFVDFVEVRHIVVIGQTMPIYFTWFSI